MCFGGGALGIRVEAGCFSLIFSTLLNEAGSITEPGARPFG